MKQEFDHIAEEYDNDFTYSNIGKRQRNLVYSYLEKTLPNRVLNILELNCGTGQDAIWFSEKGHKVSATDISTKMIECATKKTKSKGINSINYNVLDLKKVSTLKISEKYDLIFSNFGGTNCIDLQELKYFLKNASKLLNKKGKVILVIMPKFCLWESLYFTLKGNLKSAFRRKTDTSVDANVEGIKVKTWYHSPDEVKEISKEIYRNFKSVPIGFFLPPSYLEPFFKKRLRFLNNLNLLDIKIQNKPIFSKWSDHYLIELEKK